MEMDTSFSFYGTVLELSLENMRALMKRDRSGDESEESVINPRQLKENKLESRASFVSSDEGEEVLEGTQVSGVFDGSPFYAVWKGLERLRVEASPFWLLIFSVDETSFSRLADPSFQALLQGSVNEAFKILSLQDSKEVQRWRKVRGTPVEAPKLESSVAWKAVINWVLDAEGVALSVCVWEFVNGKMECTKRYEPDSYSRGVMLSTLNVLATTYEGQKHFHLLS